MESPIKIPGMYPAKNNAPIDVPPEIKEYTIKVLLGGISRPVGQDAIFTAAEKAGSYPSFFEEVTLFHPLQLPLQLQIPK